MQTHYRSLSKLAIACLVGALLYFGVMYVRTPSIWRSAAPIPIMPLAVPWQTSYGQGSACGQIWCTRITGFWTSASPEAVQVFYRKLLEQRGWRYRCTAGPGLPWCFSPPELGRTGLSDLFDKAGVGTLGWDPLAVEIGETGLNGWSAVRIVEPAPLIWQSGRLPNGYLPPILGTWRGIDSEGRPFVLRFLLYNVLWIARDAGFSVEVADGRGYMWFLKEDGLLELWGNRVSYRPSGEPCPELPAFLQRACILGGSGLAELSVSLTMRLDGDTMTLTTPDGRTQIVRQDD